MYSDVFNLSNVSIFVWYIATSIKSNKKILFFKNVCTQNNPVWKNSLQTVFSDHLDSRFADRRPQDQGEEEAWTGKSSQEVHLEKALNRKLSVQHRNFSVDYWTIGLCSGQPYTADLKRKSAVLRSTIILHPLNKHCSLLVDATGRWFERKPSSCVLANVYINAVLKMLI